jgi:hypothetical protein
VLASSTYGGAKVVLRLHSSLHQREEHKVDLPVVLMSTPVTVSGARLACADLRLPELAYGVVVVRSLALRWSGWLAEVGVLPLHPHLLATKKCLQEERTSTTSTSGGHPPVKKWPPPMVVLATPNSTCLRSCEALGRLKSPNQR